MHAGVDLEVDSSHPAHLTGGGIDCVEQLRSGHGDLNTECHGAADLRHVARAEQQDRRGDLVIEELGCLSDRGDAEHGRSGSQRAAGDHDRTVAVAICLDHGHQGRGGRQQVPKYRDVPGDRVQIN